MISVSGDEVQQDCGSIQLWWGNAKKILKFSKKQKIRCFPFPLPFLPSLHQTWRPDCQPHILSVNYLQYCGRSASKVKLDQISLFFSVQIHFCQFQVKSEHHHLELQEAPWLYLRARSAGKGAGVNIWMLVFFDCNAVQIWVLNFFDCNVLHLSLRRCHVFAPVGKRWTSWVWRDWHRSCGEGSGDTIHPFPGYLYGVIYSKLWAFKPFWTFGLPQVSFHPDDSARLIHSGSTGFKV